MGKERFGVGVCVVALALALGLFPVGLSATTGAGQAGARGQASPPPAGRGQAGQPPAGRGQATPSEAEPADYVIGVGDVLLIGVWQEANVAGEVVVRPDGKISVNLINELDAAGLTTSELRARLEEAFTKFFKEPTVMLQLKQINSRMVFIQGQVGKPGPYPLLQPLTISQLLAIAGGPSEYAKKNEIVVIRHSERRPDGQPVSFQFNYRDFERRKNLTQDILLKPGDVIVVPGG